MRHEARRPVFPERAIPPSAIEAVNGALAPMGPASLDLGASRGPLREGPASGWPVDRWLDIRTDGGLRATAGFCTVSVAACERCGAVWPLAAEVAFDALLCAVEARLEDQLTIVDSAGPPEGWPRRGFALDGGGHIVLAFDPSAADALSELIAPFRREGRSLRHEAVLDFGSLELDADRILAAEPGDVVLPRQGTIDPERATLFAGRTAFASVVLSDARLRKDGDAGRAGPGSRRGVRIVAPLGWLDWAELDRVGRGEAIDLRAAEGRVSLELRDDLMRLGRGHFTEVLGRTAIRLTEQGP